MRGPCDRASAAANRHRKTLGATYLPTKRHRSWRLTSKRRDWSMRLTTGDIIRSLVLASIHEKGSARSPRYSLTPPLGSTKSILPCGFRALNRLSARDPCSCSSPSGPDIYVVVEISTMCESPRGKITTSPQYRWVVSTT